MPFQASPIVTVGSCAAQGWSLVIACSRCGHEVTLPSGVMAAMPPAVSARDIGAALRCEHCHGSDGRIYPRTEALGGVA